MGSSFAALAIRNYAILWVGSLGTFTAFFMSTVVQAIVVGRPKTDRLEA